MAHRIARIVNCSRSRALVHALLTTSLKSRETGLSEYYVPFSVMAPGTLDHHHLRANISAVSITMTVTK